MAQRAQQQRGAQQAADTMTRRAPDGQQEAYVQNYNLYVRPVGSRTGSRAHDRRVGGRRVHAAIGVVVARLEEDRGVSRDAGLSAPGALRRIVAGGSAAAEVHGARLRQAGRRARSARARARRTWRRSRPCASIERSFPNAYQMLPFTWRHDSHAFTFEYNQRGHQVYRVIEVDAATRHAARRDLRRAEDVLQLSHGDGKPLRFRQALSLRRRRRQRDHLDVGARRVESPLSVRRRDGQGEEPDHQGTVGRARRSRRSTRRTGRSVSRERNESEAGPVLHALLSHQLRRHRPHARSPTPTARTHSPGPATARTTSTPGRASTSRR